MRRRLRDFYRRLTFKRRLRAGGPLYITVPYDGIYLISMGGNTETRRLAAGQEIRAQAFHDSGVHVAWLGEGDE